MRHLFIFIVFSLFSTGSLRAGFDMNENCCAAYNAIIQLKLDESRTYLNAEKAIHPNNQIVPFFENYIEFLEVFISEDVKKFEQFKTNRSARLSRIEDDDSNSAYYLYVQSEILLQSAVVKVKFKEYLTAAYEIHKAYKMLEKNAVLHPNFIENYRALGFFHAILGTIPDEYKWIANTTGFKGSMQQGLAELKKVLANTKSCNGNYLKEETLILLAFIELNMNRNENALGELLELNILNDSEKSPIVCFVKANFAIKTGKSEKAIQILKNKPKGKQYFPLHYLEYMQGLAELNKLDPDAIIHLKNFIANFKGQNYIKSAYQKIAWYYLVNNDINKYKYYISQCITQGNDFVDEDKQAQREAESGEVPNLVLLRARLLTDGGYYNRAIEEIAGKPASIYVMLKDKLELTYRLGRIYHKLKNYDKAIYYYEATIKNGESYQYYFAANSALHIAYIYEDLKNEKKAISYYKKCLSIKNHDYQNSIDQKAKYNLNKLTKK